MPYVLCAMGSKIIYTCVRKTEPKNGLLDKPVVYCMYYDDYRQCVLEKMEIQRAFQPLCFPKDRDSSCVQTFLPEVLYDDIMCVFDSLGMELRFNPYRILKKRETMKSYFPEHYTEKKSEYDNYETDCYDRIIGGEELDDLITRLQNMHI